MSTAAEPNAAERFKVVFDAIVDNVSTALYGKRDPVRLAVIALVSEGHLLIEDVPGVGKTSLAKSMAASVDAEWQRVQFTPDLLPSDLVGVGIYQRSTEEFRFQPGPIFTNILLADEINRSSPKTQSALLEAMEEGQVSVDGETHTLASPFMVIATQNPVEQEGTYQLPESQLDRFMMRIAIGYPDRQAELQILGGPERATPASLTHVINSDEVRAMTRYVRRVFLADPLKNYLVDLADASRRHAAIELGLSPRATLQLATAVQANAAASGRNFGVPDDVRAVAVPVLSHRIKLTPNVAATSSAEEVIDDLLRTVPIPVAR